MAADIAQLGIEIDPRQGVRALGQVSDAVNDMGSKVGRTMLDVTKNVLKWSAITTGILVSLTGLAVKFGADYESSLVGVQKTTGLTSTEIRVLGKDFLDLSERIPVTAKGMADIGQIAGQLGIQSRDDILAFTETIAKIAVVTDLTEESAAESMARLSNIFGLPIQNIEKTGSVINELENTTTATAPLLVNFMQRLSVSSKQLGLSFADVGGISATLIDLAFNAELGGTAVSKTFTAMIQDAEGFGAQMGLTADEFRASLQRDAIGTILQWANAIKALPQEEMIDQLNEVGVEGARALSVFGALTDATELLEKNTRTANDEFERGTSLQKEFDIFVASTANQFKLLMNRVKNTATAIGLEMLPVVKDLIGRATAFFDRLPRDSQTIQTVIKSGITLFANGLTGLVTVSGFLLDTLASVAELTLKIGENVNFLVAKGLNFAGGVANFFDLELESVGVDVDKFLLKIANLEEEFKRDAGSVADVGKAVGKTREEMTVFVARFVSELNKEAEAAKALIKPHQDIAKALQDQAKARALPGSNDFIGPLFQGARPGESNFIGPERFVAPPNSPDFQFQFAKPEGKDREALRKFNEDFNNYLSVLQSAKTPQEKYMDGLDSIVLMQERFGLSTVEAQRATQKLADEYSKSAQGMATDSVDTFDSAIEAIDGIIVGMDRRLTDIFDGLINKGTNFGEAFSAVMEEIRKEMLRTLAIKPLVSAGSQFFKSLILSAFPGSDPFGLSGAGSDFQFGDGSGVNFGAPGFATGGAFMVGGSGGTDSQLVRFLASPDERVTIETPAQQRTGRGGIQVLVNVDASSGNVGVQAPQELEQFGNRLGDAIREVLVDEQRPGGILSETA